MRDKKDILLAAEKLAYESCKGDSSGHDWWHIVRVRNLAGTIAQKEGADVFICELAALLHDVADEKLVADPKKREEELCQWLFEQGLAEKDCQHVMTIIKTMSFKGGTNPPMTTLEGQVVQDADRLDAIGAIGIARVFAYSGAKGRPIHDPNRTARETLTLRDYRSGQDTAIMHFYEKSLKLKDLMNTDYAKTLALHRHQFLEDYLDEFLAEWDAKS